MTTNEATIIAGLAGGIAGAVVSAVTAVCTTKYILKRGPNYEAQIHSVNATLDARIGTLSATLDSRIADVKETLEGLTSTHSKYYAQQTSFQQEEAAKREARLWRPQSRVEFTIETASITNSLILKSNEPFTLEGVYLQNAHGTTLVEIPVSKGQKTTGYRVAILHENILKLKQDANKGGLQNGVPGKLSYRVTKGDLTNAFSLPITTEDIMVGNTICIKLIG